MPHYWEANMNNTKLNTHKNHLGQPHKLLPAPIHNKLHNPLKMINESRENWVTYQKTISISRVDHQLLNIHRLFRKDKTIRSFLWWDLTHLTLAATIYTLKCESFNPLIPLKRKLYFIYTLAQGADWTLHRTINSDTFVGVMEGQPANHSRMLKNNHTSEVNTTSLLKTLKH
jgi:hypothetical protein